jgi:hypothetical protein
MKHVFVAALIAAVSACAFAPAQADTYVRGYTLPNGTYVAPHHRSSPDSSYNNNWSTSPNINPYTGQTGTRAPTYDSSPFSNSYNSPLASPSSPFSLENDPFGLND